MSVPGKGFFGDTEPGLTHVSQKAELEYIEYKDLFPEDMSPAAVMSEGEKHRYLLTRQLKKDGDTLVVGLLNPSTADHKSDDPTAMKIIGFAERMDFARLIMFNAFAYRATNPNKLYTVNDPVGRLNDAATLAALKFATNKRPSLVVGWGVNGQFMERDKRVVELIKSYDRRPYALGINRNRTPKHPLYVPYDTELKRYTLP